MGRSTNAPRKVLVIEDHPELRLMIHNLLSFEGFDVRSAGDGLAGADLAAAERPDLIVCDIQLPGTDGFGVLGKIRANPNLSDVPFVFISAQNAPSTIASGLSLGADEYLTKPFSNFDLLRSVRNRLQQTA